MRLEANGQFSWYLYIRGRTFNFRWKRSYQDSSVSVIPNPSWLVWGRASRHQKLAPTFPGIDSCLMVTKRWSAFLEMEASLWLNGRSQNVAKGLWRTCLRLHAVGKQPSIPLIQPCEENGRSIWSMMICAYQSWNRTNCEWVTPKWNLRNDNKPVQWQLPTDKYFLVVVVVYAGVPFSIESDAVQRWVISLCDRTMEDVSLTSTTLPQILSAWCKNKSKTVVNCEFKFLNLKEHWMEWENPTWLKYRVNCNFCLWYIGHICHRNSSQFNCMDPR